MDVLDAEESPVFSLAESESQVGTSCLKVSLQHRTDAPLLDEDNPPVLFGFR